jgi:hypothetical protein
MPEYLDLADELVHVANHIRPIPEELVRQAAAAICRQISIIAAMEHRLQQQRLQLNYHEREAQRVD